jgi:hypothetical protein
MTDADVAGRKIDRRNIACDKEGRLGPKRGPFDFAAIWALAFYQSLKNLDAGICRVNLAWQTSNRVIAPSRVGERNLDLRTMKRVAND